MTNHDAVNAIGKKSAKHRQFVSVQLLAGAINPRQLMVRIEPRRRIPREMFAAARDALRAHGLVKGAGVARDFVNVFAITPAS